MRKFVTIAFAILLLASAIVASAASPNQVRDVGDESHELIESLQWFMESRAAPADTPPAAAWLPAVQYARNVKPANNTAWVEIGPKNYFTDDPNYADPSFSNSGAGGGYASGRITALAVTKDGKTVFAGAADGGVWKSTDGGQNWTTTFDNQDTLSIGALALDETASGYTLYIGTGEANTSSDSYAGIGILKSTDGGKTFTRMGGNELVGALIFRILVDPIDHSRLYAATSHGLYRWKAGSTAWQRILGSSSSIVANMVTDVVIRPGTGGATGDVIAVVGWRAGSPTNGLYESKNGGDSFVGPYNPQGYVSPTSQGRVTLAYSADGNKLYAVVQDPQALANLAAKSILEGVYLSRNGSPQGPFNQIATSSNLMNSTGSAMKVNEIGKGYQPGIQAWYNQFLAVDPGNSNHVYLGLEEVYETTDAGNKWTTLGAYWNFPFPCFSYNPFPGTCPPTTHPDQHAAFIANGALWVGNDGGVWSRPLSNHQAGGWTNLNKTLGTLQFYFAGAGQAGNGPLTIYGGLQDNGTAKVIPGILATEPFGGDGGDIVVDPTNPDNVMTEYVGLTIAKSRNGGKTWTDIHPNDPDPRFIAPFRADPSNKNHLVAGGQYVWDSTKGFDTECNPTVCDWKIVYDLGFPRQATALAVQGGTTYAAWCGPCNPSFTTGQGFKAGIATNYGGTWHQLTPPLSTRYPAAVAIDPTNPGHVYVVYSGYSRRWIIGPQDPGVGHVFESLDAGATWTDISGDLVDAPGDDVVIVNNHLVVATDVGVFVAGMHGGAWQKLGTGLPNVVVDDLTIAPQGDYIIAATHGRGLWGISTASVPNK